MRETMRDTIYEPLADKGIRRVGTFSSASKPKLHNENLTPDDADDETTKNDTERQDEESAVITDTPHVTSTRTTEANPPLGGDDRSDAISRGNMGPHTLVKEPGSRYNVLSAMVPNTLAKFRGPAGASRQSYGARREIWENTSAQQQELQRFSQELSHAHIKIATLESERDQLETIIRRMQEDAFRRLDAAGWQPECNADITRKLDSLETQAKYWAKDHSVAQFNACQLRADPDTFEKLKFAMSEFVNPADDSWLTTVPETRAWVLTQAYIMHRLYRDVFDEPFFGVIIQLEPESNDGSILGGEKAQDEREVRAKKISLVLQTLYDDFSACNVQEAVAWRVQTLRQLTPPLVRGRELFETAKKLQLHQTKIGREDAAERLVSKCLNSGIRALLKDPDQDAVHSSLKTLILKAADIAYSLWTQKIYLVVKYADSPEIGTTFSSHNDMVEPHQLQRRHMDEDPKYWDESRIALVTHPALVRHGDEGATDFGIRATLKKATCWMVSKGQSYRQ